ncbi:hypothetical protein NN3_34940 [Nocardia neocaledoniensis NBRC 108232]|uniref:Adhesin n=1 Tax=Nocardia neocaledoniensis TaxID=236511 RepID=A0A317NA75_9NOCA|nr:hypothetical protein [Nocardia neocaledoniensis]PWV72216.1 hypothetical protein DFR69_109132 [Nocardia neocaledoniensis]GEM32487.1 hypothetical protein NN3_34940 [Nocardia neocaledoniensis NBRC 108232]
MYTFPTAAPITVAIDVLSAGITVIASDRADAVVQVAPADPAKKADVRAAEQTVVDFADGVLTVVTPKSWRTSTPFGGNPSIEVSIAVPTGSRLTGTAGVGQVLGMGELGACDLSVSLGDIVIERPLGSVTAKTAKGDIRIGEAARGELRLEAAAGELEVGIRPGSSVRLETTTALGTVRNLMDAVVAAPTDDLVRVIARTSSGDITIRHTVAA